MSAFTLPFFSFFDRNCDENWSMHLHVHLFQSCVRAGMYKNGYRYMTLQITHASSNVAETRLKPDDGISSWAMTIMNSFIKDTFERTAGGASHLTSYNKN